MNNLSGFSTSGALYVPFSGNVAAGSVTSSSFMVVDATTLQQVAMTTAVQGSLLTARSVRPFTPQHTYVAIVTSSVVDTPSGSSVTSPTMLTAMKSTRPLVDDAGRSLDSSLSDAQAAALEPIRQRYQSTWQVAEQVTGRPRASIPLAFSFTTQPLFSTLQALRDRAEAQDFVPSVTHAYTTDLEIEAWYKATAVLPEMANAGGGDPDNVPSHTNVGAIYVGLVNVPKYVKSWDDNNPSPFHGSGTSTEQYGDMTVEYLAFLPKNFARPVPVIIFQHGFGCSKEYMWGLADAACRNGYGMIGIDMCRHGYNKPSPLLPNGYDFFAVWMAEMIRDNLRQSDTNLFALSRMITGGNTHFEGAGQPAAFTTDNPTFIGHSLGGVVGAAFTTVETHLDVGVINVSMGRILPSIATAPNNAGAFNWALSHYCSVDVGTPAYQNWFFAAETICDDADSFNYMATASSGSLKNGRSTSILLHEMFESSLFGAVWVPHWDSVNIAAPLGAPQVDAMVPIEGLAQVTSPLVGSGQYQFQGGGHFFMLNPAMGPENGQTTDAVRDQIFHYLTTGRAGNAEIIHVYQGPSQ